MGFDLKITVGISDFVYRQKPNSGKTYSLLSFSEIAKYAQDKLNKNEFTKGYRDGVVIVKIDDELSKQFICCLLYTSPSPRDRQKSRMPSSA